TSSGIVDLHEVGNLGDHPLEDLAVLALDRAPDPAQAKRAQGVALPRVRPVLRLHLGDADLGHASASVAGAGLSTSGRSATAAVSVEGSDPSVEGSVPSVPFLASIPSTSAMVRPRNSATSRGSRSDCSPSTVAFTRLIGFWLPSDLESTSRMPASSSTARTPP